MPPPVTPVAARAVGWAFAPTPQALCQLPERWRWPSAPDGAGCCAQHLGAVSDGPRRSAVVTESAPCRPYWRRRRQTSWSGCNRRLTPLAPSNSRQNEQCRAVPCRPWTSAGPSSPGRHERDEGNEPRLVGAHGFDQLVGFGRLLGVVLQDVANQPVAVQADHRADAPRAAIALFNAWIEPAYLGRPNNPFMSVTGRVAATTSDRPGSTWLDLHELDPVASLELKDLPYVGGDGDLALAGRGGGTYGVGSMSLICRKKIEVPPLLRRRAAGRSARLHQSQWSPAGRP
jgi:hypothetical protein